MESVFVTGANGYIGSHICSMLLNKGFKVYALIRRNSDTRFIDDLNVKLIYGDLLCDSFMLPKDIAYVVHAASIVSDSASDKECEQGIFAITKNLFTIILESKLQIKKIVYISTALVLGYGKMNISEENLGFSALNIPYVKYKKESENFIKNTCKKAGFHYVILRPSDVYGPRDRTSSLIMLKAIENGVPPLVGHGNWYFSFCYVDNLSYAVYQAITLQTCNNKAYCIANKTPITWKQYFSIFLQECNRRQLIPVPVPIAYFIAYIYEFLHILVPSYKPPITIYRIKRITTNTTHDLSQTFSDLKYDPEDNAERQVKSIVDWYKNDKEKARCKMTKKC